MKSGTMVLEILLYRSSCETGSRIIATPLYRHGTNCPLVNSTICTVQHIDGFTFPRLLACLLCIPNIDNRRSNKSNGDLADNVVSPFPLSYICTFRTYIPVARPLYYLKQNISAILNKIPETGRLLWMHLLRALCG